MLTGGQVAGLIVAVFFAIAVVVLCVVLLKLGKILEETQRLVAGITDKTVPLLGEVTTSVVHVNQELARVDAITANVQSMTGNLSSLTSLFAATLGSPIIKVAAFSYGVRKAAGKRDHDEMTKRVKAELKAEKGEQEAVSRRLIYISFGAVAGVLAVRRATQAAQRYTPAGVQQRLPTGFGGLGESVARVPRRGARGHGRARGRSCARRSAWTAPTTSSTPTSRGTGS